MTRAQLVVPASRAAESARWKFSQAVRIGDLLLCSGQIGIRSDGVVPRTAREQFEQAFDNVATLLAAAGLERHHVVDLTTYHVAIEKHLDDFTSVRARWLGDVRPAWTAIGVAALASPDALVEIKVTAWAGTPA